MVFINIIKNATYSNPPNSKRKFYFPPAKRIQHKKFKTDLAAIEIKNNSPKQKQGFSK